MKGDNNIATESPRSRPLSGGLWALFSWLRREERSFSIESVSSVGSDRTAASFSFLSPTFYRFSVEPQPLPPPSPPTDSYRRRLRDRDFRRIYDRDVTLRRKYGLRSGEGNYNTIGGTSNTDNAAEEKTNRDRRARSEIGVRRSAHVAGKRRAPPPPILAYTTPHPNSHARHSRKRRAPPPPINNISGKSNEGFSEKQITEKILMIPATSRNKEIPLNRDVSSGCKQEKYSKNDTSDSVAKIKTEKNFLKQIFESKKRNSVVEPTSFKLLPNISELDRQATEIIRQNKLKNAEIVETTPKTHLDKYKLKVRKNKCDKCCKEYDASLTSCTYCITDETYHEIDNMQTKPSTSCVIQEDEKMKLKKMLKEMKDSIPKRSALIEEKSHKREPVENVNSLETPTLKIGNSDNSKKLNVLPEKSPFEELNKVNKVVCEKNFKNSSPSLTENVVIIKTVAIQSEPIIVKNTSNDIILKSDLCSKANIPVKEKLNNDIENQTKSNSDKITREKYSPLKISSLLNPAYIPKQNLSKLQPSQIAKDDKVGTTLLNAPEKVESCSNSKDVVERSHMQRSEKNEHFLSEKLPVEAIYKPTQNSSIEKCTDSITVTRDTTNVSTTSGMKKGIIPLSQHLQRRRLINQLEQSIAKGDEKAAADAAVKLAQLRLSCAVLSFSSQIVSDSSSIKEIYKDDDENISNVMQSGNSTPSNFPQTVAEFTLIENNIDNELLRNNTGKYEKKLSCTNKNENLQGNEKITDKISRATQASATVVAARSTIQNKMQNNTLGTDLEEKRNTQILSKATSSNFSVAPSTSRNDKKNTMTAYELTFHLVLDEFRRPWTPDTTEEYPGALLSLDMKNFNSRIKIWVEDKEAVRGPISLQIRSDSTLGELRRVTEATLGLAANMQRWIVGQTLFTDDSIALASIAGSDFTGPFYLCLVESETEVGTSKWKLTKNVPNDIYTELVQLEKHALVNNSEAFECEICMEECAPGRGAVLRECVHAFCTKCLSDVVRHSDEPLISCPATGCNGALQEREIRAIVSSADYERWLARGLSAAERGTRNAFHCCTRDCTGWALCDPGVRHFPCPVCKHNNCVPCKAIHEGDTCEQHRAKLQQAERAIDTKSADDSTRALFETLIARGEALECPECKAMITKKFGCDWLKCLACKTEICWVTRGRRWGPGGNGDTSGGCRCGMGGKKCHPSCGYCH